jgi:hypothetical protein
VPEVLEIGTALDGYFAISSRARGRPLESLDADAWRAVLPSLFGALDAMRAIDIAGETQRHYAATGTVVENFEARMRCCKLHIGLAHRAYNAHTGNTSHPFMLAEHMTSLLDDGD